MFTVTLSLACVLPLSPEMNGGGSEMELLPNALGRRESDGSSGPGGSLFGSSAATERLRLQVRRIGPHFRTALIAGERGVRKEEVARALHAASPAGRRAFVVCDAARIEGLLLHGTGGAAVALEGVEKILSEAEGGTIFVREMGRFSTTAQRKLAGLLNAVENFGGERIRVIASVSGDVREMAAAGTLRAELLARVGTVELAVAPLRERVEEIEAIAIRLLEETAAEMRRPPRKIDASALRELQGRDWPGNERELESLMRMAILASGGAEILEQHLQAASRGREFEVEAPAVSMRIEDVVEAHVQEVLRRCEGNKVRAAEVLGISRSTLYRMLDAAAVAEGSS